MGLEHCSNPKAGKRYCHCDDDHHHDSIVDALHEHSCMVAMFYVNVLDQCFPSWDDQLLLNHHFATA